MQEYRELYQEQIEKLKSLSLVFSYLIMDELYTFIGNKKRRYYIWTAIAVTKTKRYFYFYYLSKDKGSEALFNFKSDLPEVSKVYTDGNYSYNQIFGSKATMRKSRITNIIENLNSQLRDKISYLVRRTKAHAKSYEWLDNRLAWFFANKNLKGGKKYLFSQCQFSLQFLIILFSDILIY